MNITIKKCLTVLLLSQLVSVAFAQPTSSATVLNQAREQVKTISTQALVEQLSNNPNTIVIDVRSREEILLQGGMVEAPRIYNIERGQLELQIELLEESADHPIVVYSYNNQRSPLAALTLQNMGYQQVYNYAEGITGWNKAGLTVELLDKALDSVLYSKPVEVIPGVWSAIGATEPGSYENSGHNNNLSFIVTDEGVVVVNAGDNFRLAEALHHEIKQITVQPVSYVILENGQGHAAGGIAYWKAQNVPVIAHQDAAKEWQHQGEVIIERIHRRMRDKAFGTEFMMPDETFEDERIIELGGWRIEAKKLGPAHSSGDISVWLPEKKLVIAGDIAFHQRLLPIFEDTDTKSWLETWEIFESLNAEFVIPGHGEATNMDEVRKYTKGYLVYMREQISALIDDGGSLEDVEQIDQSAYRHLDTYDQLYRLNASRIFRVMEFEF